jgi:O-antigen/teichoic acid export membrane protein
MFLSRKQLLNKLSSWEFHINIKDMTKQQQLRNAVIYMIPTIVSMVLPIITLPFILKYLSPEEYGIYVISLAFGSVVVGFCQLSLFGVYERNHFYYSDNKERVELLFTIVSFVFIIMLLVGTLLFYNKEIISSWVVQNNNHGLLIFVTFLGVAFQAVINYYLTFFKNIGNAKLNVSIVLITSIMVSALNIYFVSILRIGPIGLSFAFFFTNMLIFLAVSTYLLKVIGYGINPVLLYSSIKLSLPLVPAGALSIIGKHFDKYIISVLSTIGGLGVYSISQRISNVTFTFMTTIQKVYGPITYSKMFSNNSKEGDKEIGEYLTPFAYFSVASALILSLFSEEALLILAPPEYLNGLSVINLLCISLSISFFAKQPQLMYAGKTGVQSLLSIIHFILTVPILYFFVNKYGINGAAIGYLLVSIIYNALLLWQGQKYYKIEYEWGKLAIMYAMLFSMSISVIFFKMWGLSYLIRFLIKTVYLAIFTIYGVYVNILNKNNILLIFHKERV